MDWNATLQLAILVIAYIGGIGTIGYYITNSLGKGIDDLRSDMTTQNNMLREDMKEMRDTMRDDMREIRDEMRKNNELLIAHICDHTLHN